MHVLLLKVPEHFHKMIDNDKQNPTLEFKHAHNPLHKDYDAVQFFVRDHDDLLHYFEKSKKFLKRDGLLWVCFPRHFGGKEHDLSVDRVQTALSENGYHMKEHVVIDEEWAALRFAPSE